MSIAVSTTDSSSTKEFTALKNDGQLCTVHPDWCTETGVHDDHF